jgi:site-specific recombinase XerD
MAKEGYAGDSESGWQLGLEKFLTRKEISKLRANLMENRNQKCDNRLAWLRWLVVELGLNSGLRVAEMADLQCGDLRLRDELSFIVVRNGKGGKYREVRSSKFRKSIGEFLSWKERSNEPLNSDDLLFVSPKTNSKYSTRGLQIIFKSCIQEAGISTNHSIHHLRHTYASLLYESSGYNLRLVQKQLGHSSPNVTQVYANVFDPNINKALEGLMA